MSCDIGIKNGSPELPATNDGQNVTAHDCLGVISFKEMVAFMRAARDGGEQTPPTPPQGGRHGGRDPFDMSGL